MDRTKNETLATNQMHLMNDYTDEMGWKQITSSKSQMEKIFIE